MIKFIEKHRIFTLIITLLIAIEIFYASSIEVVPNQGFGSKINLAILYHIIVFFLFTFFLTALIKGKNKLNMKSLLLIISISSIYAISDEMHQLFVSGRVASIKDVLFDLIGIVLAILIYPKNNIRK